MTQQEIREVILEIIRDIQQDDSIQDVKDDVPFREQFEMDSMDFLDIVMGLYRQYKVEVPEADYPALATMNSTVEYLLPKMEHLSR